MNWGNSHDAVKLINGVEMPVIGYGTWKALLGIM